MDYYITNREKVCLCCRGKTKAKIPFCKKCQYIQKNKVENNEVVKWYSKIDNFYEWKRKEWVLVPGAFSSIDPNVP